MGGGVVDEMLLGAIDEDGSRFFGVGWRQGTAADSWIARLFAETTPAEDVDVSRFYA